MQGITLYVGTTGTGKTTAALEDLQEVPLPKVAIDLGCSAALQNIPLAPPFQADFVRATPETEEEYDELLRQLDIEGNAAVLVDDMSALRSRELPRLCRLWRARNLRIFATTHHVSADIGQVIMACNPRIFAFRTTSPASLEWLRKWHGIEAEDLRGLGLGEALELSW